jgi:glutathione peroxidase
MRHQPLLFALAALLLAACGPQDPQSRAAPKATDASAPLLAFTAQRLRADDMIDFADAYAGRTLLAVNTASRCGFTSQFEQLEALYQKYRDAGLRIVGFPSNDFRQEHADAEDIAEVCYVNYGVTFDMVGESSVRGPGANAFFRRLEQATGNAPSWNFNKYLITPGERVLHFDSGTAPLGGALEEAVVEALDQRPRDA